MLSRSISLLTILIALSYTGNAQTVFNTLEDIWQYADVHNITVRNANYELDKAAIARQQAYMAFLPTVSATGSFTYNTSLQTTLIPAQIFGGPADTYTPVQFGQKYIYAAGVTAQLDIVNLQTWFNLRIAKQTEELNKASVSNARKTTYQQIATQYYSYLLSKEAARLAQTSKAAADSVFGSVSNKYAEGTVSLANKDIAQLNSEKAEQTNINAQYQMQLSKNTLKGLLGLTIADSIAINGVLSAAIRSENSQSFTEDPSIKIASLQSQLSYSQYKAASATIYPSLNIIYSNATQQNDNKFEPFQSGPAWYPARYWSLRASWTLFNGGTRWSQINRNKIGYYQSLTQLDNARNQSAINDENLRLSYERSAALLTKSQSIMALSLDNYRHITNRYETGLASLEDRLNAFTDYINYQNQYLNSLSDMLVQLYQVKIRQQTF